MKSQLVFIYAVLVFVFVQRCQVIKSIGENAPPAKIPQLMDLKKVHDWPGDLNHYNKGYSFSVYIKHSTVNTINIKENGKYISQIGVGSYDSSKTYYKYT